MAPISEELRVASKHVKAPSTIYRQNLKESNKKVYTEYLLQQKERSQQYRKRIKADPEKQRQQKENAKLRQRKFREKLKNESQKIPASTETKDNLKRRTRGETVLQRQKWCDAKRKYRKNLTSYKKVWIKRKDRLRKLGKKQKSAQEKPSPKGYQSMKTLYNVTSKVRKSLPESPQKFASVIKNLVQNTTPRKREAVKQTMEMHAIKKPRLEEDLPLEMESQSSLAEKAENESSEILEVEVMSDSRSKEQSRRHTCTCVKKLQQRYQIPARTISLVKSFFMREDISTPLPQKRYANKHGPGYVMQVTLYAAFSLLKKEYKECKIGFTKFTTLRPKNVRLLSASHWNYCVCTVCQNVSYKLKCLKRYLPGKIGDFDQLLNSILCTKGDGQRFHLPECIFKSCSKCKDTKLKLLVHLSSCEISDLLVTWNHWEKMVEDGKTRRILKSKRSSMSSMIEEMIQDIIEPVQSTSFAEHLFIGQWQRRQFTELKRSLPTDCVLFVMDFGKNRTVRYQDEPKSVFFTAQQITIHPVVIFYWSPDVAHLIVRHSLVFLSDDHLHDYHAVDHFFEKSVEYVKEIGIHFTKLIIFSDGCAAQYKGKGSFADLSLKNIHVERNYFGSDHGKSECDGELGCINRAVDMAILGRKVVVSCAEDMYTWCSASNLSLNEAGSKRRFFLVEKSDINRERDDTKVATLRGCRKLHQFLNIPSSPFHLLVKKLSCYCTNCRNGLTEQCPNRGYTGDFESRILRVCSSVQRTKPILQMPKACSSMSIRQMRKTPAVKPSELTSQLRQTRSIVQPIETIPQLRKARSYMPPKARSSAQPTKSSSKTPKAGSTVQPDKSSQQPMKSSPQMCKTSSYIQPTGTRSTPQMPKAPSYPQPTMDCLTLQAVKSTPKTPKTFAGNKASGLVLWEKLGSCNTYNDLQQIVVETEQPHLPELPDITFVSHKRVIDESALGLIPEELKNSGLFPSIVYGDGNCLPRCASLLAYGHEENHNEMRSRIIAELVRNEDKYLDDKFLTKGSDPNAHSNIAKQFAMFSDHYTAEKLTNLAVQRIFREEVLGACQSGKYMGIWQIAALANILETDIVSVYPLYGGKTVRKDLNRTFMPFHSSKVQIKEVYIMWSNVHGINVTENDWHPNHFVPLLKTFSETSMSRTVEGEVLQGLSPIAEYAFDDDTELSPVADYAFDDDAQDFLDSSLVNNIIQGLDDIPEELFCVQTADVQIAMDVQTAADDDQIVTDIHIATDDQNAAEQIVNDVQPAIDVQTADEQIYIELGLSAEAMKYKIGDFVVAKCGTKNFPCLIVPTPCGMQSLPDVGVWVQYLKKAGASLWSLEENTFFLELQNIDIPLEHPSVQIAGSRVYYNLRFN